MLSAIEAAMTALEQSGLGMAARGSAWLYPLVNLVHVLGAALLVGAIATFDVQLLRGAPHLRTTYRAAMPVAALGLALQIVSGIVLLSADATAVVRNPAFQFKMAMFALGLVNVAVFYWRYGGALAADTPLDRGGFFNPRIFTRQYHTIVIIASYISR